MSISLRHWPVPSNLPLGQIPPPPDGSNLLEWVLWGVLIIVGTLAATVGFLYKAMESKNKVAIDNMKEQYALIIGELKGQITILQNHTSKCEDERKELYVKLHQQDVKLDQMQEEIFKLRKA